MSIIQNVTNGQITGSKSVDQVEKKNASETKSTNSNDDNRNMFLQLLVTEMKYQDPMSPSDNSEYIKQMATFSQVESVQNMQKDVDEMRGASLVGKYVSITDEDGNITEGKVDFTTKKDGEVHVSVEGNLYPMTKVTGTYEAEYYEANLAAETMANMLSELPPLGQVTYLDEEKITAIANLYNSMDSYQESFLSEGSASTIRSYVDKLNEVLAKREAALSEESAETSNDAVTNTAGASGSSDDAVTNTAGASGSADDGNNSDDTTGSATEDTASTV